MRIGLHRARRAGFLTWLAATVVGLGAIAVAACRARNRAEVPAGEPPMPARPADTAP